jgi:hypothetical protein
MGKENRRPPVSRFLFIITPLFPHCTPLSACVLCVLVGLYPSRLLRLDVFTTSYKIRRITRTRVSAVRKTDRKRRGQDRLPSQA